MKSFARFAVSFFVLCLVIFAFGYFFGPASFREALHDRNSPVGQLGPNDTLVSPGEQKIPADTQGTQSGTTQTPETAPATK